MNTKPDIGHVWFDFTDTIAAMDKRTFESIVYSAYSELTKKPISDLLKQEYKTLLQEKKSNAALFSSLGMPSTFLSEKANVRSGLYHLTDVRIPSVFESLGKMMPVSIFSNTRLDSILPELGVSLSWFKHILGPDNVKAPKPALEGFLKMIELSGIPASCILYIGDDVEKDLAPAKQCGMQTGLMWKKSKAADHCFADFREIEQLLVR